MKSNFNKCYKKKLENFLWSSSGLANHLYFLTSELLLFSSLAYSY